MNDHATPTDLPPLAPDDAAYQQWRIDGDRNQLYADDGTPREPRELSEEAFRAGYAAAQVTLEIV